jgi:hypothetical protein
MPEEVGPRVREIVARRVGNVVRDLDLFHLTAIDGVGTKIAWNRGHRSLLPRMKIVTRVTRESPTHNPVTPG